MSRSLESTLTPEKLFQHSLHFNQIKKSLPPWTSGLHKKTISALKTTNPTLHNTLKHITPAQNRTFKKALSARWKAQHEIDQLLKGITDIPSFAEPLLKQAIKSRYKLDLDVNNIYINLYIPKYLPITGLRDVGSTTWRVSLLDAALHNFELHETLPYAYLSDSGYISRPNEQGHYALRDDVTRAMPVLGFTALCRALNLGARYNAHLRLHLGLDDRGKQLRLKAKIRESHRADLQADMTHASLTQQMNLATYESLGTLLSGMGNSWQAYRLTLFSLDVEGPVIFMPEGQRSVVVHIPHDPLYPIKEYSSLGRFSEHLTERLKNPTYQHFFSRFITHDQLGQFFGALKKTYFRIIIDTPSAPDDALIDFGVTETLIPLHSPELDYSILAITDDLWEALYSRKLVKIFNDGKSIAVSTDAEDRKTRQDRRENLKSIGLALLNAATLVIAPFVPVVGELMLLQMAYQLIDDVYEGVHDWVKGKTLEAFEHLFSVFESVVQAGLFAGAGKIVGDLLPKPSAFVEGMHPIMINDGSTRLWNPDISVYSHDLSLPETLQPDSLGLRRHDDKIVLKLNHSAQAEHTLVLEQEQHSQQYTLRHPDRAEGYAPSIRQNSEGTWLMEGERPQTWQGSILMRRLGHVTDGLSNAELEHLRTISGTDEGVLRRVHMHSEPIPPLLKDSLTRLKIQKQNIQDIALVREGKVIADRVEWLEALPTELAGWPENKALKVYSDDTLSGSPHIFGNPQALPENTLEISQAAINQGQLWPRIAERFNQTELAGLVGSDTPQAEVVNKLQGKLADHAYEHRESIFDDAYSRVNKTTLPQARLIESSFAQLPAPVTRTLLETASPLEIQDILQENRIPLRLKNLATELQSQTMITRAREGLLEDDLLSPEAEKIALNTLKIYTDALSDLAIEVRELAHDGALRCAHTPEGAILKRILVRLGAGNYAVYDKHQVLLKPASRFHSALLKALPEKNLAHLNSHLAPGQNFKQWLAEKYRDTTQIRIALDLPSVSSSVTRESETLLRGIGSSRIDTTPEAPTLEQRIKALYPYRDASQIELITQRVDSEQALQHLKSAEAEKTQLFRELEDWATEPDIHPVEELSIRRIYHERSSISRMIMDAWLSSDKAHVNKAGRIEVSAVLDFSNRPLGLIGADSLRLSKPVIQVAVLMLDNCRLISASTDFLKNFPSLRVLTMAANALEQFPAELKALPRLKQLTLPDNRLVMEAEGTELLKRLPRLQHLDLSNNPLKMPPSVGHMPDLRSLMLNRTQITQWPEGLFAHPRPKDFDLRLLGNEITAVPRLPDPSEQSWLVANTRLERQKLDLENQDRVSQYRRAHGLDPYRTYPPRGEAASSFWLLGPEQMRNQLQEGWNALEKEHGSQGFFEVIERMQIPESTFETEADRIEYQDGLQGLSTKVWRLILAANNDSSMRNTLFLMASSPTNCADAGAQIFNAMGLEVMVYEIYEAGSPPRMLERNLIKLARGKARLVKIHDIARADVAQRVKPVAEGGQGLRFTSEVINGEPGTVDEVEVHTGYQARLSRNLALPWVPSYMVYRITAGVGNEEFLRAYRLIKEGEEGDGLVNQLLEVPFWEDYLEKAYPAELGPNTRLFEEKEEWLDQLRNLQERWANSAPAPESRNPTEKAGLIEMARKLAVPEAEVLTREPMSDTVYYRIYSQLADERKEVSRQLTRTALTNADLD